MQIIIDFLKSFKRNTTIGELLVLIEHKDIDIDKMICDISDAKKESLE
jgi:hypothetical protein